MDNENLVFLKLLSAAIRGSKPKPGDCADVNWEKVFSEARAHRVHMIIYPIINKLDKSAGPPGVICQRWKKAALYAAIQKINSESEIEKLLYKFQKRNIRVLALKGLYLQRFYPESELRTMIDFDLLIHSRDIEVSNVVFEESGYSVMSKDDILTTYIKSDCKNIELHTSLFHKNMSDNIDAFNNSVWDNPLKIKIGQADVLTLSISNTMIYIVLHFIKHLKTGGARLRQMADIVLFVENNKDQINWEYFWEIINENSCTRTAIIIFETCTRYFDLERLSKCPYKNTVITDSNTELFISSILVNEVYDGRSRAHSIGNSVGRIAYNEKYSWINRHKDIFIGFIYFIFPRYRVMSRRDPYLKKYPFLLPIAWLNRIIYRVFIKKDNPKDIIKIISIAIYKKDFLDKMDL